MGETPEIYSAEHGRYRDGGGGRGGHLPRLPGHRSGEETKSKAMDYCEEEFVPWHIGTVM